MWRIAGEGEEVTQTEERQEILELLRENERMKPMVIGRARRSGFPLFSRTLLLILIFAG